MYVTRYCVAKKYLEVFTMLKIDGIRMKVFTNYVLSGNTAYIHIYVPLSIDHESQEIRDRIYRTWIQSRHLPKEYGEINEFIDQVKKITRINQIMLGKNLESGNYLCLIIVENDIRPRPTFGVKPTSETITQLEKLIFTD